MSASENACQKVFTDLHFSHVICLCNSSCSFWGLCILFFFNHVSDAVKSWNWRLNSRQTIKQVFFIMAPGTRGISPPKVCTERTHLLGIHAMLMYTFIIFARNAYHSFTKNSLLYGNVRRACLFGVSRWSGGVFRLSCSLLISVVCIPVLPRPSHLKGLFRSPLSCNHPVPIIHEESQNHRIVGVGRDLCGSS